MTVVELLFATALGDKPQPYNWRDDPRARPVAGEINEYTKVHAEQCTIRQIEIKQMFAQSRMERYRDRQLLLAILAMLLMTNVGAVRALIEALLP